MDSQSKHVLCKTALGRESAVWSRRRRARKSRIRCLCREAELCYKTVVMPFRLGVVLVLAVAVSVHGALRVYPAPAGLTPSPRYRVEVSQDGKRLESFVYLTTAKWRSNKVKDTAWTTPAKLSVEFDDSAKSHPLLIFADPSETNVPSRNAPNVVWFGPGVHELPGGRLELQAAQAVYLAGGAFVRGRIVGHNANGVRILGRGVLSGDRLPHTDATGKKSEHFVVLRGDDVVVDGPTFADSPHFNLTIAGQRAVVRNVKTISWWFSTDGVQAGRRSLIEDCFFKVNDDALKLYHSDTTVRRCVIWQMENGAPFQISWNMPGRNAGFRVSDCDVIRVEHSWNNDNEAVFCAIHGGSGHMSDYLFENIRIENARWRLVSLVIKPNEFAKNVKQPGGISNVTFCNVTADGPFALPNRLRGFNADSRIEGVTFDHVRVGERLLTSLADHFEVDTNTVRGVRILPESQHR